ncbi:MAG TPA: efflux RND transporter periplasmic adaptor subunit [Candidatus Binatia bacterium]|nr:efflux RND transporter periplasmic adaptor subunit [Candidatus Binatia bacterium]
MPRPPARPLTHSLVGLLLSGALVSGCGGDAADATARDEAAPTRKVRMVQSVAGTLPRTIPATGTLAAEDEVVLNTKVAGRLDQLPVDIGTAVRTGDTVAVLDLTDFHLREEQAQTALAQARSRLGVPLDGSDDDVAPEQTALARQTRAVLEQARLQRTRLADLWKDGILSRAELDAAEADYRVAEARAQESIEEVGNRRAVVAERRTQLSIAQQQLADATLRAPFDGVVRERHLSVGRFLAVGEPVVTIVRMHPLRLRLPVPEREAASVQMGQRVELRAEGSEAVYAGTVVRLSPSVNEATRTLLVEAEVPNPEHALRPGAFASAEIVVHPAEDAVLIPAGAVVAFAGVTKVLTVSDGKIVEARVRTGRRRGDQIEILEGIAAGTPIVAEPGSLTAGQAVAPEG